jgi:ABC-type transport system substrate-binding protein
MTDPRSTRKDCVESLKRWGKRDRFGRLLMAHTAKIAPVDKKTFTLELAERFGPVLEALGKASSNVPFMMPARIASTPVEEQITELVGSGPFKVAKDEWKPGDQVVYVRNPDYIPRNEAPRRFLYPDQGYLAYVSTKAGAVRFSTPVDLRRQLAGVARGTPITITYKGQEGGRKLFEVTAS